jgi:hypothetical protein
MKICPLLMMGRSKAELAYIRGAVARKDEEVTVELECLEELCAWWDSDLRQCSPTISSSQTIRKV